MVRVIFSAIFLAVVLSAIPAHGLRNARPFAGIGILVIRPFFTAGTGSNDPIPVYEEPGIRRIAELKATALPGLLTGLGVSPGNYAAAVMDKKGDWVKVAYDDADREGWIRMDNFWEYIPWRDYLKGCHAVLLPKLRKSDYELRAECSNTSVSLADIPPLSDFRIIELVGDWAKVLTGRSVAGCIRWRGNDGRFLIFPGGTGP